MSRPPLATDQQIAEALRLCGGVIAHAAGKLNITRQQLSKRVNKSEPLKEAREEGRAELLDNAESELFKAVRAGKPWAVKFVLSRLGRDRGYGPKLEVDATVGVGEVAILRLPHNGREPLPIAAKS